MSCFLCFTRCCCFIVLQQKTQATIKGCTETDIQTGPSCCIFPVFPWNSVTEHEMKELKINEYALVENYLDPKTYNRYEFGPKLIRLTHWADVIKTVAQCPILDQDDYMVVQDHEGNKRNERGPKVFQYKIGELIIGDTRNTVQVPVNSFMIIHDSNNRDKPVQHHRGPLKFFPEPFQTIVRNKETNFDYFSCIEINQNRACHIVRTDGKIELIEVPQYYMPEVGERVLKYVDKTVLLYTDFCILKGADGKIAVMNGRLGEANRAFFIRPFYEFLEFNCDTKKTILSTLPTFMPHKFQIRTQDNVQLELDVRISYEIANVDTFSQNPIDFYPLLKNHIQNDMLDSFAKVTLRQFMTSFADTAQNSVKTVSTYFETFGIKVLDIQVINYRCVLQSTQELLETDIHTNVTKQNELRARQQDVAIQEENNKVLNKQKDLEVQMAAKDNEVSLKKKQLENDIRIKEMEISIQEEHKRKELLEVRRGNDLVEAEFEGRAKGELFREFLKGISETLTADEKIGVWTREMELEQAKMMYDKVKTINMYPPGADLKMYNFATGGGI